MQQGIVKTFFEARGFGFIAPDDGGADLFVHVIDVEKKQYLSHGQRVSYEIGDGRNGRPCAVNVRPL
jgi:cold shock protein